MTPEFFELFKAALGAAFGAVGAYVAIRSDLADLKARVTNVEKTGDNAHRRIDDILSAK